MSPVLLRAEGQSSTDAHLAAHQICQEGVLNPVSPEMWTMFHFGDNFQADPNQGTLGLSIPIFTYSDERFNIPIELCYNTAGGYRPNVQGGPFGMGWTLSCLGAITREIRGVADEEGWTNTGMYGFLNKHHGTGYPEPSGPSVYGWASVYDSTAVCLKAPGNFSHDIRNNYFRDFAYTGKAGADFMPIWSYNGIGGNTPSFETLPDIFHFTFLGRSGSFFLLPDRSVQVFGTQDSPLNYSITVSLNQDGFFSFIITTEDNYVYTFGGSDATIENSISRDGQNQTDDLSLNGTWRLSSIASPDGRTVTFKYEEDMFTRTLTPNITIDNSDLYSTYHYPEQGDDPPSSEDEHRNLHYEISGVTTSEVHSRLLTKIVIGGRDSILFTYGSARCEQGADPVKSKKLESITICSIGSSQPLRSAFLSYHLTGTGSGANYPSTGYGVTLLSSVTIPGFGRWSMSYDSEAQTFPPLSSRAIDWMGYHNGNTSQNSSDDLFCPSLVTVKNHLNRNWMLTLRQGNLAAARMGMLISISYPTGGRSDFEYELNDYSRDTAYERTIPGVSAPGYGIRISRIINRDADGRAVGIRNFSYIGLDGRSSGRQLWRPALYVGYSAKTNILNSITHETLSTADAFPYSRGVFIEYDRVLETVSGGQSFAGASITERRYDSYSSLGCRDVTSAWSGEYHFDYPGGWYYELIEEHPASAATRADLDMYLQSRRGGRVIWECEYSDDTYHPVRSTEYTYNTYTQQSDYASGADMQFAHFLTYTISLQDPWLASSETTEYAPDGSTLLTKETTRSLDNYYRLGCETLTDSAGGTISTHYEWFPYCPAMLSKMLVVRNNSVIAEGVWRQYESITNHPSLYVPICIKTADPGGSPSSPTWRTESTCSRWSARGLPLEICDKAGLPTALVWAWDGMYLAAKVVGKSFTDIVTAVPSLQGGVLAGNLTQSAESSIRALQTADVSTYTWNPLVGLNSVSGASGKTSFFSYDGAGRLSSVQNHAGTTLVSYQYNILTNNQ